MYSVVNANPAYVLLAALDLLSGCEIQNSSGTFVSSPKLLSVFCRNFCQFFADTSVSFLQKLLSGFCRNGLYPYWCRMCRGAVGFWGLFVFLMHLTIHPYSKLRKALSCGSIHNHFVRSATGQKQSEQSNFLFSCTVSTAVQAVKLALCVCLLKYSFSESKPARFKL